MNRPWLKFFPGDWKSDLDLQGCSLSARGFWIESICAMHQGKPYGHLSRGEDKPMLIHKLARLVGCTDQEATESLAELEAAGVTSKTPIGGVVFSRRMVRDSARSKEMAERGALGGNPKLNGKAKDKQKDKHKKSEADIPPPARGRALALASNSGSGSSLGGEGPGEEPGFFRSTPDLDTPEVRAAMDAYFAFRRKKRWDKLLPESVEGTLKELDQFGPDGAVAAFKQSINKGWKGVFPVKDDHSAPHVNGKSGSRVIPEKKPEERVRDLAERAAWNEWRVKHPERPPSAKEIAELIDQHAESSAFA